MRTIDTRETSFKMHRLLPLLLFLASLVPTTFSQSSCCTQSPPCLGSAEAANIALRWLSIFFTNPEGKGTGAGLIFPTIAENFTYYDEGFSLGNPAPVYTSRADLLSVVSGQGYVGKPYWMELYLR